MLRAKKKTLALEGLEVFYRSDLSSPYGTRTRVSTLKGWHPRPLDEGASKRQYDTMRRAESQDQFALAR